ncbi:5-formyltetrahydrofolate cyclo-ligase [Eupransor demetentiae]|uniref:5-formyltetrahydrofolate cyclo-ligase n=1 Tax=Eupransor demetentiae TaxID=3109584 RepID=A0ABM9N3Y7_9LACO|nr:5-formyltetrahydrofolate cyclo-ligase (FAU1) [Lactobacillaceae bacterium LMG 33000]
MNKNELRQQQKKALKAVPADQRKRAEEALYQQLWQSALWQASQSVALTLSLPFELNTEPLIRAAWQAGKRVLVPKITDGEMHFVTITTGSVFDPGVMGIAEPSSQDYQDPAGIDLAIIPGLAFTKTGERLGFGAGYYDRFLSTFQGHSVALALPEQVLTELPMEPHDQLVEAIIF